MNTDPVADMLTRIRNGQRANFKTVNSPSSKLKIAILDVLSSEGYIRGYKVNDLENNSKEVIIELKYFAGKPAIRAIDRKSKPGRRNYSGIKTIKGHYNNLGIFILSTSKGVMSDENAKLANVGGEILCSVY